MRRILLSSLPFLVAAYGCGGQQAGAKRPPDETRELACAGIGNPPPVEIHQLYAGWVGYARFSACGHLLAEVDGKPWLAAPDLATIAPLPFPGDWIGEVHSFSPTGEQLLRTGVSGSILHDLATGTTTELPAAENLGFFPTHARDRSLLARCTDDGLVVVDRGVERNIAPGVPCARAESSAVLAPRILSRGAEDQLLVVDLEHGTVLDTGLPLVEKDFPEPNPHGQPGYRSDAAFLSQDGGLVLHMQRWMTPDGEGNTIPVGPGEVTLVDAGTGATAVLPGDAGAPLGYAATGFVWSAPSDRTPFASAAGDGELALGCYVAEPRFDPGQRMLLTCHHRNSRDPVRHHVVDLQNLTTQELGAHWSAHVVSRNVRAVAGCPIGSVANPSCGVPTIRRWMDGDGVRDISLDRAGDVAWVGDDGSLLVIATERDEGLLLDPEGRTKTRFPLTRRNQLVPTIQEAGGVLLVKSGSLELLVPETGVHRRLAEDWGWSTLDDRGERVTFTVPYGDGAYLYAGAVPK
jgi:hypothetical protein